MTKQKLLNFLIKRRNHFQNLPGHSFSANEVNKAIDIIVAYLPPEAFEDESPSPVSEPSDEEIEKAAEEAAIKEGFPNLTGGAFEATYADLHNVYKKGYRAALQSKGSEEKQK